MPDSPRPLEGRTAIVTGAGRGIGRATALALASRGASVVVNDLGASLDGTSTESGTAGAVVAEIEAAGGRAVANGDSVSEWPSAQRIAECALDHFGQIDFLVNNAGLSSVAPIWEIDVEDFDRVVRSHLHGTFHCMRAATPHMKERGVGRVVNLVSRAGLIGVAANGAYGAGKGGVFALTNVAARDLEPFGVTVNAVNPAATETRMVTTAIEKFRKEGGAAGKRAEGLVAALQPPEQVAALITALCHNEAAHISGQIFYIEKGRVGLFQPLEIERDATTDGPWSIDSLLEATASFEPYPLGAVYGG
ncbi:MAG: SDR family NAD(P)-dependent oxidoreductase [Deltaproteobacteria bacterium]|jgi:NAD(P)-dependent dehydrogenase (short-subunit alcohol dehydrogenase family)|nr:SDR family NAD(P)-dependent oxidoreductase [Deltaproteobacteria bacterium]MBW2497782.1 SDR family NAD(P)-dependent oxidoreductase [Deltaproteobacteria bacterium]